MPSSLSAFIRDPGVALPARHPCMLVSGIQVLILTLLKSIKANTWIPALKALPERRAENLDSGFKSITGTTG
ncbi:hypothetical protein [Shewanella sp.]|uniref:hypothetical protein n=1 Tax=Shewanella sp. TaxID=50422 RepID=UPI0040480C71